MKFTNILAILMLLCFTSLAFSANAQGKNSRNIDEAISQSRNFLFDGNATAAIDLLQKTSSNYGENGAICEALAYAFSQNMQYASAAIYFEKAFSFLPNNTILLLSAGRAYEQCNASDSALYAYERYAKLNPKDADVWKSQATIFEAEKNYPKALSAYTNYLKNLSRLPNTSEACEVANLYLKTKDIVTAKAWLESALGACANDNLELKTSILLGLIEVALLEKDLEMLDKYDAMLNEINPSALSSKFPKIADTKKAMLDAANLKKKKEEEAQKLKLEKELEEAQKLEEERLALEAKEKEAAEALAEKERKLNAQKLLEESKKAQADSKQAQESSEIRAMLDPQYEKETQAELPEEVANTEEVASAEEVAGVESSLDAKEAEILDKAPALTGIDALIFECKELLAKGKYFDAENLAHNIIAEYPNSGKAWAMLAEVYKEQDMSIDAFLTVKHALTKSPKDVDINLMKLQIVPEVEGENAFLSELIEANKKFPESAEIVLALARAFVYFDNLAQAIYFYEMFEATTSKSHPLYRIGRDELRLIDSGKMPKFKILNIANDLKKH